MSYNFDERLDRRNSNGYKWQVGDDELPMWVADMDFRVAPEIIQTLEKRIAQDAFGYNIVSEDFQASIVDWWQKRHQFKMKQDWILFCTGVVPAISSIVRKMTRPNENIVILTPVYNIFFNSIINNERRVLPSEMNYQNNRYEVNFVDLEEKLARAETTMLIFCNPHNPIGKVWDLETLILIGEMCIKYGVLLLSDEIHCDLTHDLTTYIPFASVSEKIAQNTITCISATKAFNLAGIQTSAIIVPDPELRKRVERGINTDEVAEPNSFAIQATVSAFSNGEGWLEELNLYLKNNRNFLENFIQKDLSEIVVVHSEATYLAWLDCSSITNNTKVLCQFIREKTGLYLSEGDLFGGNGHQFVRLNYACPLSLLKDGLQRLKKGIHMYAEAKGD
ncbi:pyridoxal phosphate-dependent aminotransferase [Enterococcus sp. BWM-S5]|uniref:cysteine-S-conjugate beta-lyase n=1 Tax=Enterococcus larvae TaxID=2794352 RepID=A0ABS4CNE3_9ENTE|nr:pyridoxal phosphate-dependent aminotransferase [Enterococcus larvae]